MRQAMVEYEGCRLAYECQGTGPAVLFIQGVGVQGRGWQPQTSQISKTHMCIDYDNRGLGKSQPNTTAISLSQLAQDARAILDDAQISTAHVVGHSLGGLIALQLALDFPKRVRSLSLLCTFTGSRTAAPLSARLIWFGIRSRLGTRSMRRNGFMRLVMPPGETMDHEVLSDLFGHDIADQPPIVGLQLRAMRATDLTDRLSELSTPTLIVSAVHDPIAPVSAGRALHAGIVGSRYVEAPDASHGLPITHATWVNQMLLEHFHAIETA